MTNLIEMLKQLAEVQPELCRITPVEVLLWLNNLWITIAWTGSSSEYHFSQNYQQNIQFAIQQAIEAEELEWLLELSNKLYIVFIFPQNSKVEIGRYQANIPAEALLGAYLQVKQNAKSN